MKKIIIILILIAIPAFVYFRREYNKPAPQTLPVREEIDIIIIPGWNLRQIAADWQKKGLIKNEDELYKRVGKPAYDYTANGQKAPILNFTDSYGKDLYPLLATKQKGISYEGYFFPDTYRIYKDSKLEDILEKVFTNLEDKVTVEIRTEMNKQKKNLFTVLIMASLVEREAQTEADMKMVADIFWRRYEKGWALQSCASVNYITGKSTPAVSAEDQQVDSLYNTYKYSGLPLGPVGNPNLTAIKAVLYPTKNSYWYFMSGTDGKMRYATTLDEHNANVWRYLR
jgi:UPF0755 protein